MLGVTLVDVMNEFHRYSREKGLHTGGAERFPWAHPVMYWVVTDTRRAMYQRQLSEAETEKYAAKKLEDWALKVAAGEQIPSPVLALENNQEAIPTNHASRQQGFHPEGKSFGCMPNAASLGALTPAQWLRDEYLRGKEREGLSDEKELWQTSRNQLHRPASWLQLSGYPPRYRA